MATPGVKKTRVERILEWVLLGGVADTPCRQISPKARQWVPASTFRTT